MAVRSLNPLEQHAGKIFLGIVLLICLVLVLRYVTGDPVKVEKGAQSLSVDQARQNVERINRQLADSIRPDAPCRDKVIQPDNVDFDPSRVPAVCNRTLGNTGMPLPREGVGPGTGKPQAVLVANLGLLTPLARPKVASDEKVCGGKDIRYVSVCTDIPANALKLFREDLVQQGVDKSTPLPENLALLFYRLELQRQLVDEQGQQIGDVEDVPVYTDPRMPAPSNFHEKDNPFPGIEADPMLVRDWVQWMVKAMGQNKPSYENWLSNYQNNILWPKLPPADAQQPPTDPVVDGFVVPGPAGDPNAMGNPGAAGGMQPGQAPLAVGQAPQAPTTLYALDTTVKAASRYIYRIRYVLFNPLLGQHKLRDDQNFQVGLAAPAWSPWSQPVATARDSYAWLIRDSMSNEPAFRVYRKVKGAWYHVDFPIHVGEPVGRVMIPPRGDFEIDFRTGLVPVDVRPNEEVMVRFVEQSGRVILTVREDTQVVLRDATGRLTTRSVELDSSDYEKNKAIFQYRAPAPPVSPVGPAGM